MYQVYCMLITTLIYIQMVYESHIDSYDKWEDIHELSETFFYRKISVISARVDQVNSWCKNIFDGYPWSSRFPKLHVFMFQIMIRSIFLFLDRTYVLQNSAVASLWWV